MLFTKEESTNSDIELKRLDVKYVDKSKKFYFKQRDYSKQFSHLYSTRLEIMTKLLASRVKDKWGKYRNLFNQIFIKINKFLKR